MTKDEILAVIHTLRPRYPGTREDFYLFAGYVADALITAQATRPWPKTEESKHMKTVFQVIPPVGPPRVSSVDWPEAPTYDQIKALVQPLIGADIEHVWVTSPAGHRISMFVDASGAGVRPVNPLATLEYRRGWMLAHPKDNPDSLPMIYGPAVLFDRRVWY
jgi:hypothetical protein